MEPWAFLKSVTGSKKKNMIEICDQFLITYLVILLACHECGMPTDTFSKEDDLKMSIKCTEVPGKLDNWTPLHLVDIFQCHLKNFPISTDHSTNKMSLQKLSCYCAV